MDRETRKVLLRAITQRVAKWPDAALTELLQSIDDIEAKHRLVYRLTDDERAAVHESVAQADRGEFVPDDLMADFFKRHS
jgi:hypothetical protein